MKAEKLVVAVVILLLFGMLWAGFQAHKPAAKASKALPAAHPQEFTASWIGSQHEGGITRSGRIHYNESFTAAVKRDRKDLDGRWLLVTPVDGGAPIYVLVTDRLPDGAATDIDLSMGAVRIMGEHYLRQGVFRVRIEKQ